MKKVKNRNNYMYMPFPNGEYTPNMNIPFVPNELDNRVSALERSVKKLEQRVSKLEGTNYPNYNTSLPDVYNQNIYPNAMHMM